MFAVREEIEVLREQIKELMNKVAQLEYENNILRQHATPETLALLAQPRSSQQQQQQQQQQPSATSTPRGASVNGAATAPAAVGGNRAPAPQARQQNAATEPEAASHVNQAAAQVAPARQQQPSASTS